MDMRLRFGIEPSQHDDRTCIIVVEISVPAGTIEIGIFVDAVSEVLNIKGTDIEKTPEFGIRLYTDYILGMARMDRGVKILLDIDEVFREEEMRSAERVHDSPAF